MNNLLLKRDLDLKVYEKQTTGILIKLSENSESFGDMKDEYLALNYY